MSFYFNGPFGNLECVRERRTAITIQGQKVTFVPSPKIFSRPLSDLHEQGWTQITGLNQWSIVLRGWFVKSELDVACLDWLKKSAMSVEFIPNVSQCHPEMLEQAKAVLAYRETTVDVEKILRGK